MRTKIERIGSTTVRLQGIDPRTRSEVEWTFFLRGPNVWWMVSPEAKNPMQACIGGLKTAGHTLTSTPGGLLRTIREEWQLYRRRMAKANYTA